LGTDYQYTIITNDGTELTAAQGGGEVDDPTIVKGSWPGDTPDRSWSRFKFIRQSDGSYALQTANGVNFVTALQGGGLVQKYSEPDCGWFGACIASISVIFHTDATQVQSWERSGQLQIHHPNHERLFRRHLQGFRRALLDDDQAHRNHREREVPARDVRPRLTAGLSLSGFASADFQGGGSG
jgi:hypothetical protein